MGDCRTPLGGCADRSGWRKITAVRMRGVFAAAGAVALLGAGTAEASFTQELGSPIPVEADPYDLVAADFNADDRPDVAVANGTAGTVSILLRGPAAGSPRRAPRSRPGAGRTASPLPTSTATAGSTSRARTTTAAATRQRRCSCATRRRVLARGPARYAVPNPGSVVAADFTGDGRPDLAFGSAATDSTSRVHAQRRAGFSPEGTYPGTGHRRDLVAADFNGDGQLDLAVANDTGGTVSILLRNASNTGFTAARPRHHGRAEPPQVRRGRLQRRRPRRPRGDELRRQHRRRCCCASAAARSPGARLAVRRRRRPDRDRGRRLQPRRRGPTSPWPTAAANVTVLLRSGGGFVPDPARRFATGQPARPGSRPPTSTATAARPRGVEPSARATA